MTTPTFTTLHDAICRQLEAAGFGTYVQAGNPAPTSGTAIVAAWLPDSPDTVIAVTIHGAPILLPDTVRQVWRFQVRTRAPGGPNAANDLADSVHDSISVHHREWDGIKVDRCHRYNAQQMGRDSTNRWERADNYELITH